MDFKAVYILSRTVTTLIEEMSWDTYGSPDLHAPVVQTDEDCRKLDLLTDVMGTLTRMMDTRINYVTSEGKVIREWIENILEIGRRYRTELELIKTLEKEAEESSCD